MKPISPAVTLLLTSAALAGCGTYQAAMNQQKQVNAAALGELKRVQGALGAGEGDTSALKAQLNAKKAELARVQAAIAGNSSSSSSASANSQQLRDLERLKNEVDNLERALVGH
jgi:Skp family chaperone for outer membrane proteins